MRVNHAGSAVKEAKAPDRQSSAAISRKQIWIDLDNSPHVPFFAPIIEELKARGYSVTLTTRDAFQVNELVDLFHFKCKRIGRHYGKARIMKVLGTGFRAFQLALFALHKKPDLSVSHGSRAQTIASKILGIPSLVLLDYEFAQPFPLMWPTWVMAPEVIPLAETHRHSRALQYPGIKEDVYVPSLQPDPAIKARLGLNGRDLVVVLRPPASEAHYHSPKSDELFAATMDFLSETPNIRVILLPRTAKQGSYVRQSWPAPFASDKIVIPEHAEDGLNLIWHSDLVISGGGTMNREAAALGVPVYSIFRGKIGAVDHYLAETGRLVLIETPQDVRTKISLTRRRRTAYSKKASNTTLMHIANNIVAILEPPR